MSNTDSDNSICNEWPINITVFDSSYLSRLHDLFNAFTSGISVSDSDTYVSVLGLLKLFMHLDNSLWGINQSLIFNNPDSAGVNLRKACELSIELFYVFQPSTDWMSCCRAYYWSSYQSILDCIQAKCKYLHSESIFRDLKEQNDFRKYLNKSRQRFASCFENLSSSKSYITMLSEGTSVHDLLGHCGIDSHAWYNNTGSDYIQIRVNGKKHSYRYSFYSFVQSLNNCDVSFLYNGIYKPVCDAVHGNSRWKELIHDADLQDALHGGYLVPMTGSSQFDESWLYGISHFEEVLAELVVNKASLIESFVDLQGCKNALLHLKCIEPVINVHATSWIDLQLHVLLQDRVKSGERFSNMQKGVSSHNANLN